MVPLPFTPASLRTASAKTGELLARKCRRNLNVPLEAFARQASEGCNPFTDQSSQPLNSCDLEQIQNVGLGLSSTSAAASRSFTDPGITTGVTVRRTSKTRRHGSKAELNEWGLTRHPRLQFVEAIEPVSSQLIIQEQAVRVKM
jgi:hypothetical protein